VNGQCSKRWAHRCANGKGRRCRCACAGQNHGKSNPLSAIHEPTKRELRARSQFNMFGEIDVRKNADDLFYPTGSPPDRLPLDRVEHFDDRVLQFGRGTTSASIWIFTPETSDTKSHIRPLEQRIVYHSPTGMEWGYGGSGPTDTAINVLALVVPTREAVRLSHAFKDEFIATIPRDGGELRMAEVRQWVATYYRAEMEDGPLMKREHEMREALAEIARLDAETVGAEGVEA
jgi:hypothetical protein